MDTGLKAPSSDFGFKPDFKSTNYIGISKKFVNANDNRKPANVCQVFRLGQRIFY